MAGLLEIRYRWEKQGEIVKKATDKNERRKEEKSTEREIGMKKKGRKERREEEGNEGKEKGKEKRESIIFFFWVSDFNYYSNSTI